VETKVDKKDNRVTLTIEVPPEDMTRYMRRVAKDMGKETQIKGFRTGAAPYEMLERQFGAQHILEHAARLAVRETYVRALMENEIETVGAPDVQIQKLAAGNPLVYVATASLLPTVKLGDYGKIKVSTESPDVSEEDIEKALITLQRSRATYEHVHRPSQKGDRVEIDFVTTKQGVAVEGGTSHQHPLVLGEDHFMPGFEDRLVGMSEGEKKEFSLTAPKDYYHKELAGQELNFSVTMLSVQKVNLPDLDASFASSLGKFSSLEELKKSIKGGILQEKEERAREKTRIAIIEDLIEKSEIDVPEELVEEELEKMEREFITSLKRMNIEKESYLQHLGTSVEQMKKDWKEQAKKRVKAALILRTVAEKEKIHVSPTEVDERAERMLQSLSNPEEAETIDHQALRDHAHASARNEKVFELLEKNVVKNN